MTSWRERSPSSPASDEGRRHGAALGLLVLVALVSVDAVFAWRAWTRAAEVVGVIAASAGIAGACVLVGLLGARATSLIFPRRELLGSFLVGVPAVWLIARLIGGGHVVGTALGGSASLLVVTVLAAAWLGVLRAGCSSPAWRSSLALVAVGLVAGHALVSLRMLPVLHLASVAGALGIALALLVRTPQPSAVRLVVAALACTGLAALALAASSNVRFVAHSQAPGIGALLGLRGLDDARSTAATARTAATPLDASLADAHLVLITIDALRADALGCYGGHVPTPNLDALAARGLRYTHAYAQAPHTAYSVTSLLTSTPPEQLGAAPPTLTEVLRGQRWFTEAWYPDGLFFDGRGVLSRYAERRFGFAWTDTRTLDARTVTDSILDRLARLEEEREPRAFLWAHYFDPHEPYVAHPGYTKGENARARYEGEVAYVDAELGRLFAALGRLQRPVLIVVTADHGEEHGEHGGYYHGSSLYEEQVRVPLLLVAPGIAPRVIDEPVELLDVVPTVSSLLGVRMAGSGRDLLQPRDEPGDAHASVHSKRMLVRGRYKLIHDLHGDFDELYDLNDDPGEQRNLAALRPDVVAPLRSALAQWFGIAPPGELVRTLRDRRRPPLQRAAAASALGHGVDEEGRDALFSSTADPDATVAAAATLALGELRDERARPALVALLDVPGFSTRAALALGRLGDARALPRLLEALEGELEVELRRAIVHVLGSIGDPSAAARLDAQLADLRVRSQLYLALGRIAARHPGAHLEQRLLARLAEEPYEDARAHLVWALSLAGTGVETAPLVTLAQATAWPIALEGLTRSKHHPSELVGGVDFGPEREAIDVGLHGCRRNEAATLRQWTGSSTCRMRGLARVHLAPPRPGAATLFLRARADQPTELVLRLGETLVGRVALSARYTETRLALAAGVLGAAGGQLALEADGEVELDYALVLPEDGGPRRLSR